MDGRDSGGDPAPVLLDVVWDGICPWCLVGKLRLSRALEELRTEGQRFDLRWRPFQLNPFMPSAGMDRRAYRSTKFGSWAQSQALDAQVRKAGRQDGVAFRHDLMLRTPNTLDAHRLAWLAEQKGVQEPVVEAILTGYFEQGRDIGDREVLADMAAQAGLDRGEALAFLSSSAGAGEVRAQEAAVAARGLRGVPAILWDTEVVVSGVTPVRVLAAELRLVAQTAAAAHHQRVPATA
jgi:predicted DsbA family dithiol-disulfide isomerase